MIDDGISFVGWSEQTRAELNKTELEMSKRAYWISIYNEVLDEKSWRLMPLWLVLPLRQLVAAFRPRYAFCTAENGQMQRTVLIEFDSVEAANAAYKSDGYAKALAELDGGVVREVRIIESAD